MSGEVIKSFLVGLGFDVDDASLSKFNKSITAATLKVAALYTSIKVAAAAITYGISEISESFEKLGYEYRLIVPAINKAILLRQELLKAYSAAGINIYKVIQQSVRLNLSLTKTKFALEAIYKSVGSRFFDLLTKQSDIFRQKIYQNMPRIQAALEGFVKFIFKALQVTTELGERVWSILSRVYDFFVALGEKTNGWSNIILGLVAAWKFLNLEFLATPLGQLLALGLAILALYDDIKTFYEGGKSLIDWGSELTRVITGLIVVLGSFYAAIKIGTAIGVLAEALSALNVTLSITGVLAALAAAPFWAIAAAIAAVVAGLVLADEKWKIFGGNLSGFVGGIGGSVLDAIGGRSAPLGTNSSNNAKPNPNVNQNVNQQTNINISGSANANATGSAVAGQQQRVNQDMTRNFKTAVQ